MRTGGGVSVPAPIWACLRARYTLPQLLELPSRGGWCGGCRGGRRIVSAPIFAAAGCSSKKRERQRGGRLRVSLTAPDWRFPQGPGVSVPDFCKGAPAIPRRRQEGRIYAARPAEAIFSLGPSTARSLFVKNKKRMGGGNAQPSSWLTFPVQRDGPRTGPRHASAFRGEKMRRPAFRPAASRFTVMPKIP